MGNAVEEMMADLSHVGSGKFKTTEEAMAYVLHGSFKQPLGKGFELRKSYIRADGSLGIEGWVSTPAKDIEKDVMEPESFAGDGLHAYMQRGAPISVEHNTRTFPVGFMQKSLLVRDGKIIQQEDNPKHPVVEPRFYEGGTGWYGVGTIYDKAAAIGVMKGTVSSFSWLGMPVEWDNFPDGGKHFTKKGSVNPLLEVTVTAYPVNTTATMRIAKSLGYIPHMDRKRMAELLTNPVVLDAVVDILVPPGTASAVIQEQLEKHRFGARKGQ